MPTLPINALGLPFRRRGLVVPPVLSDGNTVAWFDKTENITKDGSNFVSAWGDKSGNGNDLLQAAGTNQPLWSADGVLFDGIDNFMKCAAFTLVQPTMIYLVVKQITWALNDRIFDGEAGNSGVLYQTATTPGLKAFAGTNSTQNDNLVVNTFGIIRILFNGASSKLIVNETTPVTGNFGASDMGGFILGSAASGASGWSNIQAAEPIIRKIADTAPNEQIIYDFLASKYSIS